MASEKQIEANRRNAQLSTGPVTPEGKAAVSQNAVTHGLRSGSVLYTQDEEILENIREGLAAEWEPQGPTESVLVEQMAVALHKRNCFEELEAEWQSRMDEHCFSSALQIIWRRQAALERTFHKALDALLKLRKARAAETKIADPEPVQPEPVEIAGDTIPSPRPSPASEPFAWPDPPKIIMLEHPPRT